MSLLLLHILSSANVLSQQQIQQWPEHPQSLTQLLQHSHLNEKDIAICIANYYDLSYQRLSWQQLQNEADLNTNWLSLDINQLGLIPRQDGDQCFAYCADPNAVNHLQQLQHQLNHEFDLVICHASDFEKARVYWQCRQLCYNHSAEHAVLFINNLLHHAILQKASDIHIEPKPQHTSIRLRIDGVLQEHLTCQKELHQSLIARLKVLANCDTNEQRLPQDGRFSPEDHPTLQCRLNTCRLIHAEKAVIRLNDSQQSLYSFDEMGLLPKQLPLIKSIRQLHQGLILVTGPTGCGKTNTLYTLLQYLNSSGFNITSIENPVEIELDFLNQCNVHQQSSLSMSELLRAILRQDPDIIMIGEIRDQETASIALRAAQTGHLVLSTLHTNHCIASILRLQQLGISTADIVNSLQLVITQRLIRLRCHNCAHKSTPGCAQCHQGYKGRRGIFEVLKPNNAFRHLLFQGITDHNALIDCAVDQGMIPLQSVCSQLIASDITDANEIDRVVSK